MKRKRKIISQIKEPITIPHPEKLPEFVPVQEPTLPKIYPEEIPIENPQPEQPTELPPYELPKPSEFPLK